jgi:hypothetical protein
VQASRDDMRYLKVAAIVWGLGYLVIGVLSSFTLNDIGLWSSVTLLFCLFLLPLPITIVGVWLPRIAGMALFGCILVNVSSIVHDVISHHSFSIASISRYAAFLAAWDIPHLLFGAGYVVLGRTQKISIFGGDDRGSSVGTC